LGTHLLPLEVVTTGNMYTTPKSWRACFRTAWRMKHVSPPAQQLGAASSGTDTAGVRAQRTSSVALSGT